MTDVLEVIGWDVRGDKRSMHFSKPLLLNDIVEK